MKKYLKIGLISLAIVFILLFGLNLYVKFRLDDLMKSRVGEQLGPEYKFEYSQSKLDFFNNHFQLIGPSISRFKQDSLIWSFSAHSIQLSGFKYVGFIFQRLFYADSIVVNDPDLRVFQLHSSISETGANEKNSEIEELKFKIELIGVNNANLKYDPPGSEKLESKMNILVQNVSFQGHILDMIDSLAHMEIAFPNLHYTTNDSVYTVSTDLLSISKHANFTSISNFKLRSNISPTEQGRRVNWKKPLYDLEVEEMAMAKPKLMHNSTWHLEWVEATAPNLTIKKDNRFGLPDRKTNLPQTTLKNIESLFKIDSIRVSDATLTVRDILSGDQIFEISITEIQGLIEGLQNCDYAQPAFKFNAQAKLMNTAPFDVNIAYKYGNLNPFSVKGSLVNTKFEFMDALLQSQLGIKIAEGQLDQMAFDMDGNEYGIGGSVDFRYHDLQIHMVDKATGEEKEFLNFLSNAAGGLLFWKDNPNKSNLRTGEFYVERDVRKGFISQWIDGITHGILVTVSKIDPGKIRKMKKSKNK